jgi:nucleotide-binding universal stress UspA family protein
MQVPKSILLHLDSSASSAARAKAARLVAESFAAEVTALYCTTPALMRYPYPLEATAGIVDDLQRLDDERKAKAKKAFEAACAGSVRLKWEESEAPGSFGHRALYADLIILGRQGTGPGEADDSGRDDVPVDFVPHAVVSSGRPALIIPPGGRSNPLGDTVLVAWKETRESARAVAAALPWLRRARSVHIACYDADSQANLPRLQKQLEAQGVAAKIHRGGSAGREAGELLLSVASDLGADLLVMGCYGHSRSFEWVLGGATRTLLHSTAIPVLMVH